MSATYDPEIYDLITPRELGGDTRWYRDLAVRSGEPVLELGAGTGRVTLEIARAGIPITALDSHPGMLARLTAKAEQLEPEKRACISTSQADMTSFQLDRRFKLVIAPFRAFLHKPHATITVRMRPPRLRAPAPRRDVRPQRLSSVPRLHGPERRPSRRRLATQRRMAAR